MLSTLANNWPKAIVLYNLNGNGCTISNNEDLESNSVYTMNDELQAREALNMSLLGRVEATITGQINITDTPDPEPSVHTSRPAVVMSILYSITALVTFMFTIIIATGAIRAHRYPERYGPRAGVGGCPR